MKEPKLIKHTVRLHEGQLSRLRHAHPNQPQDVILRRLIEAYLSRVEAQMKKDRENV
jgi:hypothetical protein